MKQSMKSALAMTALATALVTGGIFHYLTVTDLNNQITTLQEAAAAQVTSENLQQVEAFVAGLTTSKAPIQGEGDAPDNWIYGNAAARYTLVEMTDTECPYCRDHFPLLKSMIDSSGGHMNAALLHIPAISEASRQQAIAIECAGEQGGSETAWKFTQLVFDSTEGHGKGVATSLASLATELNLDRARFSACMDSTAVVDRVVADMEQALKLDIKQTPSTMVIDNVTGNSLVLQGANSTHEGILDAITKISKPGASQ